MKKYIFAAVLSLALLASPAFTQAASLTSAQISAIVSLLQSFGADSTTIANVSTALNGGTTVIGDPKPWCHTFNTDLTVGSSGSEVEALQKAIQQEGKGESGVFDENTAAAVVQFQAKYGIRQTGYVGPITRAKLNALYGCHSNTLLITTTSQKLPQATVGTSYSVSIGAQGGTGSYSWRITNGTLPPGLATVTGECFRDPCQTPLVIGGTPTTAGTYSFTVAVSDGSSTALGEFGISVTSDAKPSITVLSPNGGETFTSGQQIPISWSGDVSDVPNQFVHLGLFDSKGEIQIGWITGLGKNGSYFWDGVNVCDGTSIISTTAENRVGCRHISPGQYRIFAGTWFSGGGFISDKSDAPFSIVATPPVSTPITLSSITPSSGPVGTSVRLDGCGSDSTSGFTLVYTGPKSGTASIPVETLGAASGCGYMTFAVPTDFPAGTYTLSVKNNQTGETSTNTKTFTVTASDGGTGSTVACTASFSPNPVKTGDITTLNFQSGTNDTLFQYSCNHQFTKEDGTAMLSYGSLPLGGSWRIKAPGPLDCTLTSWNPNVTGSGSTCRAILKTISETTTTTVTVPAGACTTSFSPSSANIGDVITWNFQSGAGDTTFQYSCNHAFTKEDGTTPLSYGPLPSSGSWRIRVPGYGFDCTLSSYNPSVTGSGSTCRATLKASSATNTYSNPGLASALGAFSGATNPVTQSTSGFNYTWNRDLQIGSPYQGDVIALQQALTREGVYAGEITGGFYNQTYTAVQAFQRKHGIDATGYVGPITREKLNALY